MQRSHFGVLCVKHCLQTARSIPSCFWLGQHFLWICAAPNSAWRQVIPAYCLGLTPLPHIWERLLSLDYGFIYLLPCDRWGSWLGAHQPVFLQLYWLIRKSDCPPCWPWALYDPSSKKWQGSPGLPSHWSTEVACREALWIPHHPGETAGISHWSAWLSPLALEGTQAKHRERHIACRQPPGAGRNHAGRDLAVHHGWVAAVLAPCLTCSQLHLPEARISHVLCLLGCSETFQLPILIIKERQGRSPDSGVSNYIPQYLQRSSWPAFVYTFFYVCFQVLAGKDRWLLKHVWRDWQIKTKDG